MTLQVLCDRFLHLAAMGIRSQRHVAGYSRKCTHRQGDDELPRRLILKPNGLRICEDFFWIRKQTRVRSTVLGLFSKVDLLARFTSGSVEDGRSTRPVGSFFSTKTAESGSRSF
jgi:hypothetical protein